MIYYLIFSYLFGLGSFIEIAKHKWNPLFGITVFIFSPITVPIIIGMKMTD